MGKTGRLRNAQKAIKLIQKSPNGQMAPMGLMDEMDISESGYYQLKKYLEYKFQDWVIYDKRIKMWCMVNETLVMPQKTLEEEIKVETPNES